MQFFRQLLPGGQVVEAAGVQQFIQQQWGLGNVSGHPAGGAAEFQQLRQRLRVFFQQHQISGTAHHGFQQRHHPLQGDHRLRLLPQFAQQQRH